MKKSLTLTLALLISACATTHPGQMATVAKGQAQSLKVSAERQSSFSDDHYDFVTITVESKADDMIRIKSSDINFDDANKNSDSVLVGKDLVAWADAREEEAKKDKHNKKLAQAGLMLGGLALALVGHSSHNAAMGAVGSGAMIGGAGWSLGSNLNDAIEKAHNPKQVPEQHIYAPFSVPAGKFVRKWVVVQHPKDTQIHKMLISMTFEDGSETTYAVTLK